MRWVLSLRGSLRWRLTLAMLLVKEREQYVNEIKGLCAQQGIHCYGPIRPDRHERLAARPPERRPVRGPDGPPGSRRWRA